jgi:hypothetical protein
VRECGNCKWFVATAPNGWEPPSYDSRFNLVRHLVEANSYVSAAGWPGKCAEGPLPADVKSNYGCSRWELNESFLNSVNDAIIRRLDWGEREDLRRRLKEERNRSRARYRELREIKRKSAE